MSGTEEKQRKRKWESGRGRKEWKRKEKEWKERVEKLNIENARNDGGKRLHEGRRKRRKRGGRGKRPEKDARRMKDEEGGETAKEGDWGGSEGGRLQYNRGEDDHGKLR